jgi:predicted AlkP superfamily phosphohydrolase/phosphomutase
VPRDDLALAQWFHSAHLYREVIDWARTQVYMPTPGCFGLNLNLKGREAQGIVATTAQRRDVERQLHEVLTALREPAFGGCGFELVHRDEVYHGDCIQDAPDYLMVPDDWSHMPVFSFDPEVVLPPQQVGVHMPDGILFAAGPGVVPEAPVAARIEDVTPFILAQLGLPVPDEIDGHWLLPTTAPIRREVVQAVGDGRALTETEAALMDRRLAEIGYLACPL